jgi:predicted unusual protein kinase regulating ubiquinone biosynthesis (AarF/ABC1/UbiB family)
MSYLEGRPVDDLVTAPQAERNRVMTLLIGLIFRELFEFRLMQTDPNFANYRYAPDTGQLMLLDFGATRAFPAAFAELYRRLLRAGLAGDRAGVRDAALQIGFLAPDTPPQLETAMLELLEMSLQPMRQDAAFDFGASDLAMRMRDSGMAMAEDRAHFRIPPMDTLFLQRKFGGIYMLATKMRAQVNLRAQIEPHL